MGKKKKTYVRPEMKIIEVKTEGVIAASGIIVDESTVNGALTPNCVSEGSTNQAPVTGYIEVCAKFKGCKFGWDPFINNGLDVKEGSKVRITNIGDGQFKVTVTGKCE